MYTGCIYRHWLVNDKGKEKSYVGQVHSAKDNIIKKPEVRWNEGRGYTYDNSKPNKQSDSKIANAIRKYGWDNFNHDILLKIECQTLDELMFWLDEWEKWYIEKYDSFYNGYNSTLGGKGAKGLCGNMNGMYNCGEKHPLYGKHLTEEHRGRISNTLKGRTLSNEHRAKISIANTGEGNGMYNRPHTEESREKMRMNRPDQNGSNNPNAKSVICLNNGYIFATAIEAGKWCGVKTVAKAARKGRVTGIHPETGEKLVWMYLDEFNNLHMTNDEIDDYIKEKQTQRKPYSQGDKNPRAKRVVCLETMQVFTTIKKASEWCGSSSVGAYLKGKTKYGGLHPNTGQPLHWMYYNDWLELQNN